MWHVMVASTSPLEQPEGENEEEGQISVVFWSATFVLLLIVTVWFYITQISTIRGSAGEIEENDKEEEVAKRLLEHLGHDPRLNSNSCEEDKINCCASGSGEAGDPVASRYEYIDDEIHIHYSKCAWEDEDIETSEVLSDGAQRRHSMENMDLIFPGFLPSIVEEDENEGETASESSEESQLVDDIHHSSDPSIIPRALKSSVSNHGGATTLPIDEEHKWSEVVTMNLSPTVSDNTMIRENIRLRQESGESHEPNECSRSYTTVEYAKDINKEQVSKALETNELNSSLIYSKTVTQTRLSEAENNEITMSEKPISEMYMSPADHEVSQDLTSGSFDICSDTERNATTLKNAFQVNGDVIENPSLLALSCSVVTKGSSHDANKDSDLFTAKETDVSCSSENGTLVTRDDLSEKHAKSVEKIEERLRCKQSDVPKESTHGLDLINMAIKMEDAGFKSNGFLEHIGDRNEHTTHAWTFFSMSGTDEVITPQNGILSHHDSKEQVEVPKIIINTCDDGSKKDIALNTTYMSLFETDIDVDDIDLISDDESENLDGECSVYFKRNVSVTDLDKILFEEGPKDSKVESPENVLESDLSLVEPLNAETVEDVERTTTEKSNQEEICNVEFANETKRIENDPSMNMQRSVIVNTVLSSDNQNTSGDREESACSTFDAPWPETYTVETILNDVSFSKDGVYGELASAKFGNTQPDDLEDDGLESFGEHWSGFADISRSESRREQRLNLFTIPEDKEIGLDESDQESKKHISHRARANKIPFEKPVAATESRVGGLSAPIATIDASDSEFDLDDLEENSESEPEKHSGETIRQCESLEKRDFLSDVINTHDGVTKNSDCKGLEKRDLVSDAINTRDSVTNCNRSKSNAMATEERASRSLTFVKKVKISVTKEVKVEREEEHDNLLENHMDSSKTLARFSDVDLPKAESTKGDEESRLLRKEDKTCDFLRCSKENVNPPSDLVTETYETHRMSETFGYEDKEPNVGEIQKLNKANVLTKTEQQLPSKPEAVEVVENIGLSAKPSAVESPSRDLVHDSTLLPNADTAQSTIKVDTEVNVRTHSMGSNIGINVYVTEEDREKSTVLSENTRTKIHPVIEPPISADQEQLQSRQPSATASAVTISVQGKKDSRNSRDGRKRHPKDIPRSSPVLKETPRKTYLSSCNIRLTRSYEDLRFIQQVPDGFEEASIMEEEPASRENMPEEGRQPTFESHEDDSSARRTKDFLSSPAPDVNLRVPGDDMIESAESDTIHTARITVQEVVGDKKRIVILNVRKKVHGAARWKSLNDLDTLASLHRQPSSSSWNGMASFTEENATSAPSTEDVAREKEHRPQRALRVEVKGRDVLDGGSSSLDTEEMSLGKPASLTETKDSTDDFLLAADPKGSVSSTSSIDGDKDFARSAEDILGASKVMVTDLDALLAKEANFTPAISDTRKVKEKVHVWARIEPVLESAIRIDKENEEKQRPHQGNSEEPTVTQPEIIFAKYTDTDAVAVEPIILAEVAKSEEVAFEPVILAKTADSETEANVIAAFPINDGYDDDELDEVFFENYLPGDVIRKTDSLSETVETYSSDADSETSSINSIPLKQQHRQTRAALEAAKAAGNPGMRNPSESSRSSGTATPVAELENKRVRTSSSGSSTQENNAPETIRGQKPLGQSTTRVIVKSAELTSASIPREISRTTGITRARPRSELSSPKSDEEVNKIEKGVQFSSRDPQTFSAHHYNELFKEAADIHKSMPDLSVKRQAVNDSPYLRGLSAHTRKWLSENVWMDPSGPQDEEDIMSSELFLYPSNRFKPGSNVDASFLSLANEGDFRDDISLSTVSTRPQSPMSEFSFAGETPYWGVNKGSTTVLKCSNPRCGRDEILHGAEKTSYTSCPACFTYYCSRACRRIHWSEHKKVCFFGRINSYIRSFIYLCHKKETLKFQLSKTAIGGFQKRGRGSVMVTFATAQSARKFMTTGCSFFPSPPTYSSLVDLQAEGVISKHKVALTQHVKDYNPQEEFVLNIAIIAGKMESFPETPVPRRKVNTVLQVVKVPLSSKLKESSPKSSGNTETMVFYLPKCARHEFVNENEARRHYCRNISKSLKQYGIRLKHDFPDVYDKLCLYVEQNIRFSEPLTVYGNRGKNTVVCKIMPEVGADMDPEKA